MKSPTINMSISAMHVVD